jgi:putative nucleotidyltransferase with HDIG domain
MRERHNNDGRGRRLKLAFGSLDSFPVLRAAHMRLLSALEREPANAGDAIAAIESDMALTASVLRLANTKGRGRGRVETIPAAVDTLDADELRAFAGTLATFDFFEHSSKWGWTPVLMRLHALSTQRAAARIAAEIGYEQVERLAATSLLHDVGKLVLARAYPGYPEELHEDARTPGRRVQLERRELTIDHAVIGGVVLERWGLPSPLAEAVEHHHDDDASAEAAIVRLADLLAHYEQGTPVGGRELLRAAHNLSLTAERLRETIFDLHGPPIPRVQHPIECPLTDRELLLLRLLARGKVYKQIALELALSVSTVRTHLHNVYGKLGVVNRAQAVLVATGRGWI